ncbi:hypothetical protein HDV03_001779 [Kappamyces sp. JEL0829]|nr:hypothetical protein HDV03_001779 [Kappamyces sp. JEL0829]
MTDPIPVLQAALNLSHKSLELDKNGQTMDAIASYYDTMALLDKSITLLAKRPASSSQAALDMILEKKIKYSKRVTMLLDVVGQGGIYEVAALRQNRAASTAPPPVPQKRVENYQFSDFHTSFLASIKPRDSTWNPYTQDPLALPFERLQRIAMSIRYGAFLTPSLYICPDVWCQTGLKFDNAELKQSAIQMLGKPLAKLVSIQQSDAQLLNFSLFTVSVDEFVQDMGQVRAILAKKIKYLDPLAEGKEDANYSLPSWAKIPSVFKSDKSVSYKSTLLAFLEQSSEVFLYWLSKHSKHPQTAVIRNVLGKISEFYEAIVLSIVLHDLDAASQRFVKKMKRIVMP